MAGPCGNQDGGAGQGAQRVRDELAWELVRDEWELLMAIGSGPTTVEGVLAQGVSEVALDVRLQRLVSFGLVQEVGVAPPAYRLVSAFYERREGMSTYLQDMVLRHLRLGEAPPLSGRVLTGLGGEEALEALVREAEAGLFPEIVRLASAEEGPESERFVLFFALAPEYTSEGRLDADCEDPHFRRKLLPVLESAALTKSRQPESRSAYLWVAEMRTDRGVAEEIGALLDGFWDQIPEQGQGCQGAAVAALLPSRVMGVQEA